MPFLKLFVKFDTFQIDFIILIIDFSIALHHNNKIWQCNGVTIFKPAFMLITYVESHTKRGVLVESHTKRSVLVNFKKGNLNLLQSAWNFKF